MNTQKATVILTALGLAILSGLFYLATEGNTLAAAVLFSLWTIVCVVIGWGLSILQQSQAAAREQQAFMANAKENQQIVQGNIGMMAAAQKVQNLQNQMLQQQLATVNRLPAPGVDLSSALDITDGVFAELD
jgi:hypothetical protein